MIKRRASVVSLKQMEVFFSIAGSSEKTQSI